MRIPRWLPWTVAAIAVAALAWGQWSTARAHREDGRLEEAERGRQEAREDAQRDSAVAADARAALRAANRTHARETDSLRAELRKADARAQAATQEADSAAVLAREALQEVEGAAGDSASVVATVGRLWSAHLEEVGALREALAAERWKNELLGQRLAGTERLLAQTRAALDVQVQAWSTEHAARMRAEHSLAIAIRARDSWRDAGLIRRIATEATRAAVYGGVGYLAGSITH